MTVWNLGMDFFGGTTWTVCLQKDLIGFSRRYGRDAQCWTGQFVSSLIRGLGGRITLSRGLAERLFSLKTRFAGGGVR